MPDGDGGSGCEVASRGEAGWLPCCPPVVGKRGIEAGADGVMDRLLYFWPAEGIGWQRSRLIGKEGGSSGGGANTRTGARWLAWWWVPLAIRIADGTHGADMADGERAKGMHTPDHAANLVPFEKSTNALDAGLAIGLRAPCSSDDSG